MTVDILVEETGIDLAPSSTAVEVRQNVNTIITTPKGAVPLDRAFGITPELLDRPIGVAQAKLTAEIVQAINKYEPRAKVERVLYSGKEQDGRLEVKVRTSIGT